MTDQFTPGWEGCDDPFDLGWKHGTEDAGSSRNYRPGIGMTKDQMDEYKDGYHEAHNGW